MCLYLKRNAKRRIATKDIVVFKVMELSSLDFKLLLSGEDTSSFTLTTVYFRARVKIGDICESVLDEPISRYSYEEEVHRGLHSFAKKKDVLFVYAAYSFSNCAAVKCIIPKGSTYYKGTFCNRVSYASDKLKYVKLYKDEL